MTESQERDRSVVFAAGQASSICAAGPDSIRLTSEGAIRGRSGTPSAVPAPTATSGRRTCPTSARRLIRRLAAAALRQQCCEGLQAQSPSATASLTPGLLPGWRSALVLGGAQS